MTFRAVCLLSALVSLFLAADAQVPAAVQKLPLMNRVSAAPVSVSTLFRESGMNPVDHPLNELERAKLERAIAILPPLHRQILQTHLHSISFMDQMPNNALTAPVGEGDSANRYNITFRAGILNETLSEWASQKESTSFDRSGDPAYRIEVETGQVDALAYVLLHEATHVVDAVLNLTPHPANREADVKHTAFTRGIWYKMNQPAARFSDSLLQKARFRNQKVPIALAPQVYAALQRSPFPSLYALAAWFEDIAELLTLYHLTERMDQPYRILVKKDQQVVARFEPMRNRLVRKRLKRLNLFYKRGQ